MTGTLTNEELTFYQREGYLFLPNYLSVVEVEILSGQIPHLIEYEEIGKVWEKGGTSIRGFYGSHGCNSIFDTLIRLSRFVKSAMQILESEVYVYQFKINTKAPFTGDIWPWHQDFIFWAEEDGMPSPQVVNILIFLDEVNQFNGPLFLIPRSHREGRLQSSSQGEGWEADLSADLKYTIPNTVVTELVQKNGIIAPTGPSGSVLFFHPNCVHGSASNISPFSRNVLIITYNSINNLPLKTEKMRPYFLVNRDFTALEALPDNALIESWNRKSL